MRGEILMWKAFSLLILRCVRSSSFALIHPFQPRLMYIHRRHNSNLEIFPLRTFFVFLSVPSSCIYFAFKHGGKTNFSASLHMEQRHNRHEQCVCFCVLIRKNFRKFHLFVFLEGRTEVSWRGMRWRARAKFDRIIVDLMWYPSLLFEQRFNRVQRRVERRKCSSVPLSFLRPRPYCIRANSLIPIFWFASDAIDCEMRMLTHNSFRTHAQWERAWVRE